MIVAMREEEEKGNLLHVKDQDPETERIVTEMNVKDQIQGKANRSLAKGRLQRASKGQFS